MNAIETVGLGRFPSGVGPEHVITDVTTVVPEGARVGLLGGNGAGKSTLLRLLMGLAPIGSGTASIFSAPVPYEASRARVGYLPEHAAPLEYLTGREYLELFARLEGIVPGETRALIDTELERFGLTKAANDLTRRCSKGQRQRMELARLFLRPKDLLILDEPLTGLDTESQLALEDRLLALADAGTTMVLTSHAPHLLERLCTHFIILSRGRLLRFGTRDEILSSRGWSIEVADEAELSSTLPDGANALDKGHGYIFDERETAERHLQVMLDKSVPITRFGQVLSGVEDVLREVISND